MTKQYCDKCKKDTKKEWFNVTYRGYKNPESLFLHGDFCVNCFKSIRTVSDMKKLEKHKG